MEITYWQIFDRRYPNLGHTITNNNYDSIIVTGGDKPSKAELDAHWPSVEAEILAEKAYELKKFTFQQTYDVQDQIIKVVKAILTSDNTKLDDMIALWSSL